MFSTNCTHIPRFFLLEGRYLLRGHRQVSQSAVGGCLGRLFGPPLHLDLGKTHAQARTQTQTQTHTIKTTENTHTKKDTHTESESERERE